jgi:hypothetical protein
MSELVVTEIAKGNTDRIVKESIFHINPLFHSVILKTLTFYFLFTNLLNTTNLDIYVANYVEWSIEIDIFCTLDGKNKSYCTPESYKGQASRLYRNRGDGTFENVSRIAGINDPFSKSLGVCILDFNQDGLPDIFEVNDTQLNKLYQNNGNGKFEEFS